MFKLFDNVQEIKWKGILYEAKTFFHYLRSRELPGNPSCCGSELSTLCTRIGGCVIVLCLNAYDYRKSNGHRRITVQFRKYQQLRPMSGYIDFKSTSYSVF